MVGRYPAIYLMGRAPLSPRPKAFLAKGERTRYCRLFPAGIPHEEAGTHVFLSRSPRSHPKVLRSTCMH